VSKKPDRRRGSIIPRSGGKFLLRITIGAIKTAEGKTKRVTIAETFEGTRTEAEKVMTAKLAKLDAKPVPHNLKLTVGDACEKWLALRVNISDRTRYNYTTQLTSYIRSHIISGIQLKKANRLLVQGWVNELAEKYSAGTVRQAFVLLKQVFGACVRDNQIGMNPCEYVELPRIERIGVQKTLTVPDMERLMRLCFPEKHGPLFITLLLSGLRPQEALALTWADVTTLADPATGISYPALSITKALTMKTRGVYTVGPVKTKKSRRIIPLPPSSSLVFTEMKTRVQGVKPTHFLFPHSNGGHQNPETVYEAWCRTLKRFGFPPMKLYSTRHSNISALLAGNVHPKVASERAGHSTTGVTLDIYSHVSPSMQANALSALPVFSLATNEPQ
jgi:integrase